MGIQNPKIQLSTDFTPGHFISMYSLIAEKLLMLDILLPSTDDLSDFTYTLIHMEKEFDRKEEGSILKQFTPEHFYQMLVDFFIGE